MVLTQVVAVIAITLLCGAATATVGPISFIGLMVPHIARWWVGPDQRWILPYSMLLAPILLLCADVVGRLLAAGELRVSIVAAFIGAPVLIWLVPQKTLGAVMSLPHTLHIGRPDGVINGRMPLRLLLVNISLLALCLAMAVAALCYGTLQLSLEQVFAALSGEAPKNLVTVVTQWRLPRIAMALLLGGALGMSGAIFQSIIRNPLGSPDVIGFNMGAYTGALIAITLFNGGYYYIAGGALAGGILSALAIYLLAWRQGIAGFRLIIVGIAISAVLVSTNTG